MRGFQKSTGLWLEGDPEASPSCWPAAEGALGEGGVGGRRKG